MAIKTQPTIAQESTNAIQKLYITMRHLFTRGFYKPMGVSGETMREALLALKPEIYGAIAANKSELNGLTYVIERLPDGIEECQYISLIADEGYRNSKFKAIVPPKRRRNCYRIDSNEMLIEITRGHSDIYDILSHLTFLFIESHKLKDQVIINENGKTTREWDHIENVVLHNKDIESDEREILKVYLTTILRRKYSEVDKIYNDFSSEVKPDRFLHLIYWLGKLAINEEFYDKKRSIKFSSVLNEEIGHHIYGEIWANSIKEHLYNNNLLNQPIHIISANMHSVMNTIYAPQVFKKKYKADFELYGALSKEENSSLRKKVKDFAAINGLTYIKDKSGTNIDVQIIDTSKINFESINFNKPDSNPVIIVMDYAFGEQAYETMDELIKPYETEDKTHFLNVASISIMGKAGILKGNKGDIMIPDAHIFEGTSDNYPFENKLKISDFEDVGLQVFDGSMITVLGTSLQNKNLLKYFKKSTWNAVGLEMEGAHYQKAIQAASKIRNTINKNVEVRYAYYASDNPLETGATLASGGLGMSGVVPTYAITQKILEQIFG